MNNLSEAFSQSLSRSLKRAVIEALVGSSADEAAWTATLAAFRRHGLTETVIPAPFSRLGFSRQAIVIERERLSDPAHLDEAAGKVAAELFAIIARDVDDGVAVILETMSGKQLTAVLGRLYINQSDGRGIAHALLEEPIDAAVSASPAVQAVFAALDRRFDTIQRVVERELDKSEELARQRLDRAVKSAHERLDVESRLALLELEHGNCPRPAHAEPATCSPCCQHKGRDALVEENCRRYLIDEERVTRRNNN